MIAANTVTPDNAHPSRPALHDGFLPLIPVVERHAEVVFRYLPESELEECQALAVAAAFVAYLSLTRRGKDPSRFPSRIATRAAPFVQGVRAVGSRVNSKDVLSEAAQRARGFRVRSLDRLAEIKGEAWQEALADNTRSPVPDQVCFRVDFPAWLNTLSQRDRRVVGELMAGEQTVDVAGKFGLSPTRVSQLRHEFEEGWEHFWH